jgi:hypothetical protein
MQKGALGEFLDNRDKLWKAYAYTKTSRAGHDIPMLKTGNTEVTDEREKVDLLLGSFFLYLQNQWIERALR